MKEKMLAITRPVRGTHLIVSGAVCFLSLGAILTTLHGVGKISIPGISKGPEGLLTLITMTGTIVALALSAYAVKMLNNLSKCTNSKQETHLFELGKEDKSCPTTDGNPSTAIFAHEDSNLAYEGVHGVVYR